MTALACPACGTPVVPGARFCFSCGAALDVAVEAADERSERRIVTVLFGDLTEFTAWAEDLDPERVKVVTDRLLATLVEAVQAYGGHVDKLTGDGIMAVFGAPRAHEDDPERAVRAAVRMQQAVRRLVAEESGGGRRLGLRVGLNTGEVLAGTHGALAYTVVGDTVNTASRLSDVAGVGGILAGRTTAAATMGAASWRALPPMRLKGKREPVPAYELLDLRARPASRTGLGDDAPFVGREAELGLLVSKLMDAADTGAPGSVLVTGDAGVGKTRLARELARFAGELARSRVLWATCTAFGEGRDLAPVVDLVRTACGIDDNDDADTARDRVRRTVARLDHPAQGAWAQGLFADRLLALLGLGADENLSPLATATPGDASTESDAVLAVAGLLRGLAADGPLVLVVDDLHWSGPGLRSVLGTVLARVDGPLLLVTTARSDVVTAEHTAWVMSLPNPSVLPVDPLEEAAAERLLRAYLGGSTLDDASRGALLSRAEGNPFFLAELLHLLVDRGVLRREADGWRLAGDLPADVLPAGVHAVLAARIDGLDAAAKEALRDAAVAGATFRPEAVAALSPGDVAARLAVLVERDIVRPVAGTYVFAHPLTREVAYAGIPKAGRARRHALVAAWARDGMPGTPAEVDTYVAQHAERAVSLATEMGLPPDDVAWSARTVAFDALVRLGHLAVARDENVNAVGLFARAASLGDLDEAARVAYATALANVHRLDDAEALVGDADGVRALLVLGDIRRKRSDEAGAVAAFTAALSAATDAGDERAAGEATRQLGLIDYYAGRLREAEERFTSALELAQRCEDTRGIGWAYQHLAWNATTRGDYDQADAMLAQAMETFLAFEDTGGMAWSVGTAAFVRLLQGRLREARSMCGELIPRGEALGDRWGVAASLVMAAMADAELGHVSDAQRESARAAALSEEIGDTWLRSLALVGQAMAAQASGDTSRAAADLRTAVAMSEAARQPSTRLLASEVLAWTSYWGRDIDGAEAAAYAALELSRELGVAPHAEIGCHVVLALVDRARGRYDDALRVLADIAETPERPTFLFPMRQALAHYAGTLLETGRAAEAVEVARRAVETPAEDVRSRVLALRALGSALRAVGALEEAEEALRSALDAASSTEQSQERAHTEELLADLVAARG